MSQPVVDIRGLHVRFGEVEAVAGIDVQAHAGQATALLGRNGAGKSTTMRVLAGLVPPTAGSVHVAGLDMRTHTLEIKQLSGYCPDVGGLVPARRRGSTCSCPRGSGGSSTGRTAPGTCSSGSSSAT